MNRGSLCSILITICFAGLMAGYGPQVYGGTEGVHEHHHHHEQASALPEPVVDLEVIPGAVKAGIPSKIIFYLKDQEGNPLEDLAITHDRIIHVVIISEDFSVFGHIHPEDSGPITSDMKKKAQFPVNYTFPKAGRYLVAADFGVKDRYYSEKFTIDVLGEPGMGPLKKVLSRERDFGDYHVTLTARPERITAPKETTLTYTITKGGKAVTDVGPYLAAPMHIAIVKTDLNQFIHAHGDKPGAGHGSHAGHMHGTSEDRYGPEIETQVIFPVKGVYQIFSEIKHQGKVVVFDFMVTVE